MISRNQIKKYLIIRYVRRRFTEFGQLTGSADVDLLHPRIDDRIVRLVRVRATVAVQVGQLSAAVGRRWLARLQCRHSTDADAVAAAVVAVARRLQLGIRLWVFGLFSNLFSGTMFTKIIYSMAMLISRHFITKQNFNKNLTESAM